MNPKKRYVTIKQFSQDTGISYATINHMLNTGQLPFVTTESGLRRIDTQKANDQTTTEVIQRVDALHRLISVVAAHLGIKEGVH